MVNDAAECNPTERQGSSIWEAACRTLVSVCLCACVCARACVRVCVCVCVCVCDKFRTCLVQSVGCELRLREGVL